MPGSGSFPVWIRQCLRPPLMSGSGTELMDCRAAFTEACLEPAFQNEDVSNLAHPPVARTGLPLCCVGAVPGPLPPEGLGPSCVPPPSRPFLCAWPCLLLGKPRAAWWACQAPWRPWTPLGATGRARGALGWVARLPAGSSWPLGDSLCGVWSWPVPASRGSCQELSPRHLLAQDLVLEEETSGSGVEIRNTASSDAGVRCADARGSALQAC